MQNLIADGELRQAIQFFLEKIEPGNQEILHQSSLLSRAEKDNRKGLLSREQFHLELNKITSALFEILKEWTSETERKKAEAERKAERERQEAEQKRRAAEATAFARQKREAEEKAERERQEAEQKHRATEVVELARKKREAEEKGEREWQEAVQKRRTAEATELARKKLEVEENAERERQEAEQKRRDAEAATARKRVDEAEAARFVDSFEKEMILIEGGTFMMGDETAKKDWVGQFTQKGNKNELPVHQVTVSKFYLQKTTVTQSQWQKFIGNNPSRIKADNIPVEVSWDDVQLFLNELNEKTGKKYRLPSEAEWEFAARGGTKAKGYSDSQFVKMVERIFGNSAPNNYLNNIDTVRLPAIELGLFMGHNTEWCEDLWHDNYNGAPADGSAWLAGSDLRRVVRGAHFYYSGNPYMISHRTCTSPSDRNFHMCGFRLAHSF